MVIIKVQIKHTIMLCIFLFTISLLTSGAFAASESCEECASTTTVTIVQSLPKAITDPSDEGLPSIESTYSSTASTYSVEVRGANLVNQQPDISINMLPHTGGETVFLFVVGVGLFGAGVMLIFSLKYQKSHYYCGDNPRHEL